jgi:ATP-dependent Clp protease, protease subunit
MNKLNLYGEIGYEVTLGYVAEQLSAMDRTQPLQINIFSPGGAYFEGLAIKSALDSYEGEKTVLIEGLAASMATYIMLTASTIKAVEGSFIMIHNPMGGSSGDYRVMEKNAEKLKKLQSDMADAYSARMKCDKMTAEKMMDEETWMTATEAVQYGLIDAVQSGELKAVALADKFITKNTPDAIRAMSNNNEKTITQMKAELIKALALDESAEDSAILNQVVALSDSLSSVKAELSEKSDMVKAMSDKVDTLQAELDGFQAEKMQFDAEKMVSDMVKAADMTVSKEVETKLIARAKAYQADQDEMRLEDMKMMVKSYGVKANATVDKAKSDERSSFKGEQEFIELLNMKIDEIIQVKGYDPVRDFAKAKTEAEEQLKNIGDK